jgi:S1-C subfamily serine protease
MIIPPARTFGALLSIFSVAFLLTVPAATQVEPETMAPAAAPLTQQVTPSLALVLTGEGSGRLTHTATGLIVRSDGVLLTPYHNIINAREVQVRLASGEVYDRVSLIGFDERRNIAALRIPAVGLPEPTFCPLDKLQVGQTIYLLSNPRQLRNTTTSGTLSAIRMADEVKGAGNGYRLLQFTTPVPPGSGGGVVVDAEGRAAGIVVELGQNQNLNFAVPLQSVLGLAEGTLKTTLGSGSALRLPSMDDTPVSAAVVSTDPQEILRTFKTIAVAEGLLSLTSDVMDNELRERFEEAGLDILVVEDRRVADVIFQVKRVLPLLRHKFTYSAVHQKTSVVLTGGGDTAFTGNRAVGALAGDFVKKVLAARAALPQETEAEEKIKE